MEANAIPRAMQFGVEDGPDKRCGTCDHWCDIETGWLGSGDGYISFSAGHCRLDEPECIHGEYDNAGCGGWEEAQ